MNGSAGILPTYDSCGIQISTIALDCDDDASLMHTSENIDNSVRDDRRSRQLEHSTIDYEKRIIKINSELIVHSIFTH
jgi:hypothetical protein